MQYLRARYYDPASGTFNRLDPFFGRMQDPQSLHKYLYVHGDPIQGIDPSGEIVGTVGGLLMAGAFMYSARGKYDSAVAGAGGWTAARLLWFASGTLLRGFLGYVVGTSYYFLASRSTSRAKPIWLLGASGPNPATPSSDFARNIERALHAVVERHRRTIENSGGVDHDYAAGRDAVSKIAAAYVDVVARNAGQLGGLFGNATGLGNKCFVWAEKVDNDRKLAAALDGSGWKLKRHENSPLHGEFIDYWPVPYNGGFGAPITPLHSFVSLTYHEKTNPITNQVSRPDVILDPWRSARPDIYAPMAMHYTFPINHGKHSNIDVTWASN